MAKSEARLKALQMRRLGKSIGSIARALKVSKSSASIWCRDIVLTNKQRESIMRNWIRAGYKGRMLGAEMNKKKRLENMAAQEAIAKKMIGTLTHRDSLMLGVALYWGEGTKGLNSTTAITNSDPETVLFTRDWFEQLGVARNEFQPYIFISEIHKNRGKVILRFWSHFLDIPKQQFAKIVFLKGRPKKIYENHNSYYGVLALRVRRGKTLKYRILGLINACKNNAGVAQLVRASHS